MTETNETSAESASANLAAVARMKSEPSGISTLNRYKWQTKQTVRLWLTTLDLSNGPTFVACEQVDDIALIYPHKLAFIQLKTRDRGSWTASNMCGSGIDALIRSYNAAREEGMESKSTFELWVEGPLADKSTADFAEKPTSATKAIKDKMRAQGLDGSCVSDFLDRLVIHAGQPSQAHIDAVLMLELGSVWGALSRPESEDILDRLLAAADAAQTGNPQTGSIHRHLAAGWDHLAEDSVDLREAQHPETVAIRNQILDRSMLRRLTPPQRSDEILRLTERITHGETASRLELKMRAAGAREKTIKAARDARAAMEIERQLLLASREGVSEDLERLESRLLRMAWATADSIEIQAVANPALAGRPAEGIAVDLIKRPGDLVQCDPEVLFKGDAELIYGYLGHLSDECKFSWQAS